MGRVARGSNPNIRKNKMMMKTTSKRLWGSVLGAVVLGSWLAPAEAQALEPPRTAGVLQFGAGFRYGIGLDDWEPDPWRTGLGLELGYTLPQAIYVGAVFDYFFGSTATVGGVDFSANLWQLAAEGGYDLQLSEAVLVRPKLALGMATISVECEMCAVGAAASESDTSFAAAPGLTVMFFTSAVVLSIDTRYQMVFSDPEMAKAVILSFGIGF